MIKIEKEMDTISFVKALRRAEFDTYTPDELAAFRKGVSSALAALGVDSFTLSDFRECFEYDYYKFED